MNNVWCFGFKDISHQKSPSGISGVKQCEFK
jgi:hypothetical protein